MDPIGFAMENFDAVGRWRDRDAGSPIDASGVFPDGATFDGMAGLKAALLSHPEEFVSTVTEKLLMYALGRNVQYYDRPAVRAIVRDSAREQLHASRRWCWASSRARRSRCGETQGERRRITAERSGGSMMFITKKALPRRTFLRGMGATLALPLLDAMVPALSAKPLKSDAAARASSTSPTA